MCETQSVTATTKTVWTQMSDDLRRFVRQRVRNDADAADVLQETFLRIHHGIEDLRDADRLVAWVYRIARNAISDHFRATSRNLPAASSAVAESGDESSVNLNHAVGEWLSSMIATLPETYQEAVRLVEVHGMSQQEVARQLGISLSGTKSRVQRGRQILRATLLACCHLDFDHYGNVTDYVSRGACQQCCNRGDSGSDTCDDRGS